MQQQDISQPIPTPRQNPKSKAFPMAACAANPPIPGKVTAEKPWPVCMETALTRCMRSKFPKPVNIPFVSVSLRGGTMLTIPLISRFRMTTVCIQPQNLSIAVPNTAALSGKSTWHSYIDTQEYTISLQEGINYLKILRKTTAIPNIESFVLSLQADTPAPRRRSLSKREIS